MGYMMAYYRINQPANTGCLSAFTLSTGSCSDNLTINYRIIDISNEKNLCSVSRTMLTARSAVSSTEHTIIDLAYRVMLSLPHAGEGSLALRNGNLKYLGCET